MLKNKNFGLLFKWAVITTTLTTGALSGATEGKLGQSHRRAQVLVASVDEKKSRDATLEEKKSTPGESISSALSSGGVDGAIGRGVQLAELPKVLGFPNLLPVDTSFLGSVNSLNKGEVPLLDLSSALSLGAETSLELAAANAGLTAARARSRGALAALLPRVDLRRADGSGKYTSTSTDFSTNQRSERSIDLKLPLFFPAGWMELRRQNVLVSVAELERDAKRSLAALDNGLAFLAMLSAQGRLNLTDEYMKSLRVLLEYTQARSAGGLSTQTESKRVESRIVGVEADLSEARANLRAAISNYVRLTGYLPIALGFSNPLPPLPQGMTDLQVIELVQENPELLAARRKSDSHQAEIRAGASNFLPRLDLQMSRQENENVGATAGLQMENKSLLVLTFPLFSGGADVAAISEASAKLEEQGVRIQLLERQLRADAETALAGLNTLTARYDATWKQVRIDTEVVSSFMDQIRLGNRSLLDVLDAQQRLYQSRQQLLLIGVTQAQALLRLSYLTGRLSVANTVEK